MSYTKFTRKKLIEQFGLSFEKDLVLPENIPPIIPSDHLLFDMKEAQLAFLNNEKGQSEFVITPIIREVWRNSGYAFGIHSGEELEADSALGLTGECDFIFTANTKSIHITSPIIALVEAKFEQFDAGITQVTAQLLGVQILNKKAGKEVPELWGCVANGKEWNFIKLVDKTVIQHTIPFQQKDLAEILGAWKIVIENSLEMSKQ